MGVWAAVWAETDSRRFHGMAAVPSRRARTPPTKRICMYADLKPVIIIGPKASAENRKFMAKFMNINQFAALAQAPVRHAKFLSTLKVQDGLKIPAPEHDNYSLWKYGVTTGS